MLRIKQQRYTLDSLSLGLITLQIFISMYLAITLSNTNIYMSVVSLIYISMTIAGLTLHHLFCGGTKIDLHLTKSSLLSITYGIAIGIAMIYVLQLIVLRSVQLSSIIALSTLFEIKLFFMCAGISEETFFRYYIQTKFESSLPRVFFSAIMAITLVSALFTSFHFMVYKGEMYVLAAVFVSSMVLGYIYAFYKRLTIPMVVHALVNLIAG